MSTLISRLAATFESSSAQEGGNEEEEGSPLDAAVFLYGEAVRLLDDAESGDVAQGDIKALLECCLSTLDEVQGDDIDGADAATRDALRADASVLLGRAVEWCAPVRALELFQLAVAACPGHAEAHLQCGRALCHRAATARDLVRAEEHLRRAVDLAAEEEDDDEGDPEEDEVAEDEDDGEEDDDDEEYEDDAESDATGPQARRLLARLLVQQPGRRLEAHALLAAMGYTHVLAHHLTSCDFLAQERPAAAAAAAGETSSAAAAPLAATRRARPSARTKVEAAAAGLAPCAFAFDDVLPPEMLAHLQGALGPGAPFWREHAYDSPGTGFFSYQHALPPWNDEGGEGGADEGGSSGQASDRPALSSFEQVLLHLRATAAAAVPAVQAARFAEWWAHDRPHSAGHALHFDYAVGPTTQRPTHPVVSTVTYLSARACGGPTLVTDQTMPEASAAADAEASAAEAASAATAAAKARAATATAAPAEDAARTRCGWVVVPRQNRCLAFKGSQLHCVLPGVGASPRAGAGVDQGAATAPAADEDRAGGRGPKRRKRQSEDSSSSSARAAPAAAGEAAEELPRRLTFMVAFWVNDPRAPPFPAAPLAGQAWPATFTAPLPGLAAPKKGFSTTPAAVAWRATPNPGAVWPVAEVWEPLESGSSSGEGSGSGSRSGVVRGRSSRSGGRNRRIGLDLLAPSCFTDCAALNSGLFLAGPTGACSLNCGGTCPACQAQASGSSSSSSAEGGGLKQAHSSKRK